MEKVDVFHGARETFSNAGAEGECALVSDEASEIAPVGDEIVDPVTTQFMQSDDELEAQHSKESLSNTNAADVEPPGDSATPEHAKDYCKTSKRPHGSDEISRAILQRKQPLMELVYSEEGYVKRLKMVKERYMPIVSTAKTPVTPLVNEATLLSNTVFSNSGSATPGPGSVSQPPTVPDDLAARWRIVWGNWIQLYEWHSAFLEKLTSLVEVDPDRIPKLFIDSRARLRSIYSKYCENHRKAALIAEQYRDYFEELRVFLGDKEDVVSYLMQPVQRIMRYQLPMAEIVKYTQRACSPNLHLWKKALDIMKEIPKDTQLILEAARIDGFPGVITALGNILIRGDLLVATTTRDQLLETVTAYKVALQESTSSMGLPDSVHAVVRSTFVTPSQSVNHRPPTTPISPTTTSMPTTVENQSAPTQTSHASGNCSGVSSLPITDTSVVSDASNSELFVGNMKFIESRLFLFEQMLVVTEEARPKRRTTSSDTYAQSTYQFRAAINVNKMRYESHWYNCSLPNGHTNADAAVVDQFLSTGLAPDDLRFAVLDQTPGRDLVYIIDPITSSNREAWVVQLRDIQRMQHEFLLALQDPRRFNTGTRDEGWAGSKPSSDASSNSFNRPDVPTPIVALENSQLSIQSQARQRKWPSFTMTRPRRLGSSSSSSAVATNTVSVGTAGVTASKPVTSSPSHIQSQTSSTTVSETPHCADHSTSGGPLARSLSVERRPLLRTCNSARSSSKLGSGQEAEDDHDASFFRKSSLSANSSLKVANQIGLVVDSAGGGSPPDTSTGVHKSCAGKKRNVFASLFGRNKSKHRTHRHGTHQPSPGLPPSGTSVPSSNAEHISNVGNSSHPPLPPTLSAPGSGPSAQTGSNSAIRLSSLSGAP